MGKIKIRTYLNDVQLLGLDNSETSIIIKTKSEWDNLAFVRINEAIISFNSLPRYVKYKINPQNDIYPAGQLLRTDNTINHCNIEEGRKITDVARGFDIAHSVVSRLWKSFKTTGMCSKRHGGRRVRSTTPAEDRYIVLSAKRNRRTTAQQVANQFLAASGKQISRKTVARRLRGGGLYARRPVVCVPLTRQHRTARLQWCREHHN
ncbi:hypothetical protein TNCV_2550591 [Trichonephila clavipes]|nr:hypothetical protein TNCV_2550591 [Trichonephila clavipes]